MFDLEISPLHIAEHSLCNPIRADDAEVDLLWVQKSHILSILHLCLTLLIFLLFPQHFSSPLLDGIHKVIFSSFL